MALLAPGELTVTVEFAKDLQDKEWIGRQDPYCVVRVGGQSFRTKTATDGGTNPVWDQSFIINIEPGDRELEVDVKDDELLRDQALGTATVDLSRVRASGSERLQLPVVSHRTGRQHGIVSLSLRWRHATGAAFPAGEGAYGTQHGVHVIGGFEHGGRKVMGEEYRPYSELLQHQQLHHQQHQNNQQQQQQHLRGPRVEMDDVAILERQEQRW